MMVCKELRLGCEVLAGSGYARDLDGYGQPCQMHKDTIKRLQ